MNQAFEAQCIEPYQESFEKAIKQRQLAQQDRKLDIEERKAQDALDIAKLRDKGTLNPKPKKKK